jgi:hypothetical protein
LYKSELVDVDDGLREGVRGLLRNVVANPACDKPELILSRKLIVDGGNRHGRGGEKTAAIMVNFGGHLFCSNRIQSGLGSVAADWILLKQAGDQGGVKIGANTDDQIALEIHHPAIAVVKTHSVLGGR